MSSAIIAWPMMPASSSATMRMNRSTSLASSRICEQQAGDEQDARDHGCFLDGPYNTRPGRAAVIFSPSNATWPLTMTTLTPSA